MSSQKDPLGLQPTNGSMEGRMVGASRALSERLAEEDAGKIQVEL